MNKIKVCHVTSVHPSKDGRIFAKECVSLAKAGYDVYLVAQGDSEVCQDVTIVGCGKTTGNRICRIFGFSNKIIKKAIDLDADIYHLHDPELLLYALKLKAKGKKVIFDSHENYSMQIQTKEYLPKQLLFLISFIYVKIETFVLRKINAAIIPCTFNGKNIFEGRVKRVEYIKNYPLLNEFYDKYDEKAQKGGYICYVGALAYGRGIFHLVKAAAMAEAPLVLAGKYSSAKFGKIIHNMPEYTNVDDRGFVTMEEVVAIEKGATIGICTELDYGQNHIIDTFCTKVLEYMAMGLPVILCDTPYSRKVMQDYKFGICVKPDNVEEIAKAIKYIVNNPSVAAKMGEEGRRAVREHFNWDTEAKKLVNLYKDIMSS